MVQKIDRQELQLRFLEALNGADYRFIEGLNPFHILLNGTEYWIYIKNLTSAHFANPDVWRAQLPLRDDFAAIKESGIEFIMFGYDGDNDVYATWNPIWVKQRLNSTDNVSLYSRYPLQVEARKGFQLKRMDLGNDGEVVVFPREMTRLFFVNVNSYFLNTGDYVAMGSKRRPEANEAFKLLTTSSNIDKFARYLTDEGLSSITIGSYCRLIRDLISGGIFTRYRKVFLQYDSLIEYDKAIPQFVRIPELVDINLKWHNLISSALDSYISFLIQDSGMSEEKKDLINEIEDEAESLSPIEVVHKPDSDDLFALFCNLDTVSLFERELSQKDYLPSTVKRYSRAIRYLIKEGLLEKYKSVFSLKESFANYQDAANDFFRIPEIRVLNEGRHHDYSAAMKQYVKYLIGSRSYIMHEVSSVELESSGHIRNVFIPQFNVIPRDWESEYTDEKGKLTRIANPELLNKLRPVLDREYPNAASAFNIVEDFYGSRFQDMEFYEWGRLFKQINWSRTISISADGQIKETLPKKSKSIILRVELPDGRILENKNVSTTYCEAIKYIGPEEVNILGISHAGVNIVSRELDLKYAEYQRSIGDGWYVMTNSSTQNKFNDLRKIIREYGIDMKVDKVPLDPTSPMMLKAAELGETSRAKIRVAFPGGRTIQPNLVLEALIEVVKYAGAERVHNLGIVCCGDNLVLRHPSSRYEKPCKPVGDGWFCNTYSNTNTKYEQIQTISERLNLGLVVDLIQ